MSSKFLPLQEMNMKRLFIGLTLLLLLAYVRFSDANTDFPCSTASNEATGFLQSIYYPNTYSSNIECIRLINVSLGTVLKFEFKSPFFIESSPGCKKDFLKFEEPFEGKSRVLGRYCGRKDNLPPLYTSPNSDKVRITFKTDYGYNAPGFKVEWSQEVPGMPCASVGQCEREGNTGRCRSARCECSEGYIPEGYNCRAEQSVNGGTGLPCGSDSDASSGFIQSEYYSDYYYRKSTTCTWTLNAPKRFKFQFDFDSPFNLQHSLSCRYYDSLKFEEEIDGSWREIAKYCNQDSPPPVTYSTVNKVRVVFATNGFVENIGFRAHWKHVAPGKECATDGDCVGEVYTGTCTNERCECSAGYMQTEESCTAVLPPVLTIDGNQVANNGRVYIKLGDSVNISCTYDNGLPLTLMVGGSEHTFEQGTGTITHTNNDTESNTLKITCAGLAVSLLTGSSSDTGNSEGLVLEKYQVIIIATVASVVALGAIAAAVGFAYQRLQVKASIAKVSDPDIDGESL